MCKEARAAKFIIDPFVAMWTIFSHTHLKSRNDSDPNQLILAVDVLAVTEVQVKAFGSCTTFRSLIMDKQTSADTPSSMAVGSVQCHIGQFQQTADILKPGYALPDCNLPQISRASCQMVVFPSLPPCCRSASDTTIQHLLFRASITDIVPSSNQKSYFWKSSSPYLITAIRAEGKVSFRLPYIRFLPFMNPSLNSLSLFHSINTFVFKFSSSKCKLFSKTVLFLLFFRKFLQRKSL